MMKIKFSKKKILMFLLAVIFITGFFNFGQVLPAQAQTIQDATGLTQVASATGLGTQDLRVTIAKIIRIFLGFLGIVALVIMLYGGFVYMTAGGDDQKVSMAKKIMINGTIGLVIIFSSFAITQFVLNKLSQATGYGQVGLLPTACADPVYAAANPLICNPGFNPCDNLDNQFVVKSITPVTPAGSTGMNNFAVRVIFSQPIALGTTAENVFIVSRGDPAVNVNSEFSFSFVDGNRAIVEASSPSVPGGVLVQGNYTVTVLSNLTSTGGLALGTSSVCGTFPNNGSFSVTTTGIVDSQAPTASAITYNGLTYGGAAALPRGRTYRIGSAITDNSGIGYVHLEVQRRDSVTNATIGAPVVFYDGPRTNRGSEATASNPYNFSYNYLVSSNNPIYNEVPNSYFRVTLRVTDIDHNQRTITSDFVVVESSCAFGTGVGMAPGCRGNGACVADLECLSGVCNETTGQCVNVPLISDVSPWSQAGGSWVTISGSAFGSNEGTVEFGIDNTNDGDPDVWVPASVASCGGNDVWHDNYVIVEVPQDNLILPDSSLSSVRVNHEVYVADPVANIDFFDTTTNNRGPLPGPDTGWFTKDNSLSLPGLCAISPGQGLSGVDVSVFGQKLGAGGAGSSLAFGGLAGVVRSWQADGTQIDSTVPDNMSPGFVGVVATVGVKESNGLPFRVMSVAEVNAPLIESVTPSDVTPLSYVTISGKRFGNNGTVYLSPNATTNCPNAACVILNTTLPAACGDTWNDEQIIAQVPATAPVGQRIVIVQNEFGLQSIPGTADLLNIIAGAPLPSICALSPVKGIAPLKTGSLNITGINFSTTSQLYFWGPRSVPTSTATWLSLAGTPVIAGEVETISTRIPVDYGTFTNLTDPFISSLPLVGPFGGDGFSMQSGSIKLKSLAGAGPESNSVKYTVQDCREISDTLWPNQMICCTEGPSTGSFIHESKACPGTTRTGGYVWRFTTGRIAQLPKVLEACDTTTSTPPIISPTPWRYQGNGDSICLNAQISVDFNMPIEVASFGTNINKKILLFSAGTGNEPATSSPKLVNANALIANLPVSPPDTVTSLVIKNSNSGTLAPDTWYRVVLLNGIQSLETVDIFNVPTPVRRPLLRSRPCKIDLDLDGDIETSEDITAYCFDFKTGPAGSECVLESAGVKPSQHTVDTLGPVKKGSNDLIYEVWGRGDQACSIISVDKLGWVWGAFDMPAGIGNRSANIATLSGKTHLAKATALQEPAQTGNTNVSIQASVNYAGQTIVGDSDLFINLGPARVTDYWPDCGSACINAVIGGKFSRMMDPTSYDGNVLLYQCPNENACILAVNSGNFSSLTGPLDLDLLPSHLNNRYEAQFAPRVNLTPNTSYLVYFTNSIYSVGQLDSNNNIVRRGDPLESKMWQFKTKVDSGVCVADKIVTEPDPFTAYMIGEKTRYIANPFTNPDQCNSKGQALNAWGFGWGWSSVDTDVATVSEFATVGQLKPACNYGCLPKGADIEKGTYNLTADEPWLCGNGRVDPGEDCDIGVVGETAGTSCSLNCLRPGNPSIGTGAGQCGNSIVDRAQGEECDNEVGCSTNCVHMGSSSDPADVSGGQSGNTITEYRMWYSGNEGSYYRIYLATSTDGVNWKKYNNSLPADSDLSSTNGRLAKGTVTGKGDQFGVSGPSVIKDGNIYKMWYTGFDGVKNRIYYTTSPNGFDWTKKNNTIEAPSNTTGTDGRIPLGGVGSGDSVQVSSPSVLKDGSIYKMWYAGFDGAYWRIYYATSPDGLAWTKYDNSVPSTALDSGSGLTSNNGRLPIGTSGKGDDFGVYMPTVVKDGSVYKMWYSSAQDGDINWEITFAATSPDGLNWTKVNNNIPSPYASDSTGTDGRMPLGTNVATRGDHHSILSQFVLKDGTAYKMWYTGMNNYTYRLFYATSVDGLAWTKQDNTTSTISDTFSTNGRIALGSNGRGDDAGVSDVSVIKDIISIGASSGGSAQALCGSGEVTVGEDCEPGMDGDILNVTCSSNCLHIGTKTASSWCELPANIASVNTLECRTAVSVCGNGKIEKSEECELIGGSVVVRRTTGGNFTSNAPATSCSDNCLLQNVCGTNLLVPTNNVELACDSTTEGCNPDCTLRGSSVDEYTVSSLCGDGVVGVGEFGQCEYSATEIATFGIPGQNPIQAVTAIGEGTLDPATLSQSTEIVSKIVSIRTTTTPQVLTVAQQRADNSDYTLQCGFTEFAQAGVNQVNPPISSWLAENNANDINNLNNGILMSGTSFAGGRTGGTAFNFDGTDDFVQVSDSASLSFRNSITIEAWVNPRAFNSESSILDKIYAYYLNTRSDGRLCFYWYGISSPGYHCTAAGMIPINTWTYTVATWDGSNVRLYINGQLQLTVAATGIGDDSTNLLYIGGGAGASRYWNGLIDDVAVYDYAFSEQEILGKYQGGSLVYNDCPNSSDGVTQGVGYNSCCYTRPHRVLPVLVTDTSKYYPLDGSGFSGGPVGAVCRNTAIYVTFNGDIDEATFVNNFVLAKGETVANANCGSANKDITTIMGATLAYGRNQNNSLENNGGIWNNIWNSVKKILAWFVEKATASVINDTTVNVGTWCETDLAGVPEVVKVTDSSGKVVESIASVYLSDLLDENATYAILLRGGKTGIKDIKGVGIKSPIIGVNNLNDSFVFRTGTEVCRIDNVTIPNPPAVYTSPQISQAVTASAQSADGRLISPISGVYDWSWSWGPVNDPIFNIPNFVTPASAISSKDLEGQRIGHAHATITTDKSLENNQLGQIITGDVELTAVFCERPWPPVTPVTFYPYEDGISAGSSSPNNDGTNSAGVFNGSAIPTVAGNYFNFKTSYCADAGRQSDMSDDLPYLRPFVFTGPFPDANTLKKFLFFNDLNNDAIGIQVFKNTGRDSVKDWLRTKLGVTTGFKSVSIDGYDAMADDSNYYVDALNVVGANSYNNIYLISINKDAEDNTRKVFDEIISSLEFNINFTDNKYCSGNATMSCTTDYECADENGIALFGGTVICDAQKTKMRRDWKRVVTLIDVQEKLKDYRENNTKPSPKLATGTYLPGQTRSVWPSWGNLASQIGSVGVDPLNTWSSCSYCSNDTVAPLTLCSADEDCVVPGSTCVRVDSQTCWDDINNRFICPKMSNILGYKLQEPPLDSDYTIYSPMEYFNSADMSSFLDTSNSHFVLGDALCVGGPGSIISPTSGTCGNNVINSGEVCDPPGQVIVTTQSCNIDSGTNNGFEVRICSSACQLGATATCQKISTCGNGRKEPTEFCDEGTFNGTYGHCRADCRGFSGQFCGNVDTNGIGIVDKHCSYSPTVTCNVDTDCISVSQPYATCVPSEVCDLGSAVNGLYGQGCAVDCQSRGARCGDGITQKATTGTPGADEECDDGNLVDVGDGCKNNCTAEAEATLSASTSIPTGCGDGIVQSGEACDLGTGPAGSLNGIACTPKYGEYCNYCSFDCGEVLYVEPTGYCGNQSIDTVETDFLGTNTYEACEYLPRECHGATCVEAKILHGTPPGTATLVDSCKTQFNWEPGASPKKYTTYTGGYKCINNCTKYETACTVCGNIKASDGGARPRVSVMNPMVGADVNTSTWFQSLFVKFYMRKVDGLHIKSGTAGETDSSRQIIYSTLRNDSGRSPKDIYWVYTAVGGGGETEEAHWNMDRDQGIATNLACNGVYWMCFNKNASTGECLDTTLPSKNLWPFSVKSEADYVDNTYIVSPNPPTGTVRIVLKWSEKDKLSLSGGKFGLGILNTSSSTTYLARQNNKCGSIITNSDNYWVTGNVAGAGGYIGVNCERWPLGSPHTIVGNQGVFMHKAFNTSTTYIQSMTVSLYDAPTPVNGSLIESGPFTVFVEAQNGSGMGIPMNTLLNTEAEVLIFEHHHPPVGGSPNTVFPPDYSYKIKYVQKSSNASARYWHVLNLKRNDDSGPTSNPVNGTFYKYAIEPAQKVRTDTASLISGSVNPNVVETSTGLIAMPVVITATYTPAPYQQCSNGVQEGTEVCDDGASNGNPGMCNTLCTGTVPFLSLEPPPTRIR